MPERYAESIEAMRTSIVVGPAEAASSLRQSVADRSAELARPGANATDVPDDLEPYVDKVALHAYRVVDDDIAGLKAAGYSEDEIFEITVAAAVGAALERLDVGLAAMRGER